MPQLHVRPATEADAGAIAEIYNHAIANTTATFDTELKSAEDRRAWLASDELRIALVAVDGERVVGWGSLSRWSKRCAYDATVEISVYVAPDSFRRGIGRMLTEELLQAGRDSGVHAVISQTTSENEPSLAMTASLGFERVGLLREVGRKFGRGLDVVLLELLLPEDAAGCGCDSAAGTCNCPPDGGSGCCSCG